VCISRAGIASIVASSGTDAGPSTLTSRTAASGVDGEGFDEGRKLLPDFTLGSYEEVLRMCQRGAKIACVILVSDEHDDVAEFKRQVLFFLFVNRNFVIDFSICS
jgi:FAS-associated factor 2